MVLNHVDGIEYPCFSELTWYIHLNPLMARIVKNIKRLNVYPWAGHSAIMGRVKRTWQDTEAVLSYFGGCDIEAGGL